MGQTADQLRQEIEHKREDAAAKIDRIEAKVQDLPNLAKDTVMSTVDQSLNQARTTVEEKVGQMKEQADVRGQIDQRPLAALGVAFAGGYLLGKIFGGDKQSGGSGYSYQTDWSQAHSTGSSQHASSMGISSGGQSHAGSQGSGQPNAVVAALKKAAHDAGLDNTLSALSGALVATLTDQFNRTIRETFPEFAQHLEQQGGLASPQSGGQSQSPVGRSSMSGGSGGSSGMSGSGTGGSSMGRSGSSMGSSGSSMGATSMSGSGSSTGASSMSSSGSSGSGSSMSSMSGSAMGSRSGTMGAAGSGASTYGQSAGNADAASRTYGGSDTSLGATTDASGRPTPYYGNNQATAQ